MLLDVGISTVCLVRYSHDLLLTGCQRIREHALCESLERRNESHVDITDEQPCDDLNCSQKNPEDMTEGSRNALCCLICLEPFLPNDFASWSSTDDCDHAFHTSCIEEWLLHNKECPCCRRMYLLVDYTNRKIPPETLKSLETKLKQRYISTYFCIEDGIVTMKNSWADGERHRRDKNQFDCEARNLSELDLEDCESLAKSVEEMQTQDTGLNLPLRKKVLEFLPASASHSRVYKSNAYRPDANEEIRAIQTKESTETASTSSSTNVSPI